MPTNIYEGDPIIGIDGKKSVKQIFDLICAVFHKFLSTFLDSFLVAEELGLLFQLFQFNFWRKMGVFEF